MTEARTMTLADFLLERVAEDEAQARDAGGSAWAAMPEDTFDNGLDNLAGGYGSEPWVLVDDAGEVARIVAEGPVVFLNAWHPARVLAECEAKRQIIELHTLFVGDQDSACVVCGWSSSSACYTLRLLAAPYAEHADFRAEWSPTS